MTGGQIVESFEKGTKRREGVINIIDLHGTWRERKTVRCPDGF